MPVVTPHVPDGLIELMKALTKDILKKRPENIYQFAVEHFEKLIVERDGSLDKGYENFQVWEDYFKSEEKLHKSSVPQRCSDEESTKKEDFSFFDGELDGPQSAAATQSIQRKHFKSRKLSSRKPSETLLAIKEDDGEEAARKEIDEEMRRRELAAFKIQKAFKNFFNKSGNSTGGSKNMTQQMAALIIQRTLRMLIKQRFSDKSKLFDKISSEESANDLSLPLSSAIKLAGLQHSSIERDTDTENSTKPHVVDLDGDSEESTSSVSTTMPPAGYERETSVSMEENSLAQLLRNEKNRDKEIPEMKEISDNIMFETAETKQLDPTVDARSSFDDKNIKVDQPHSSKENAQNKDSILISNENDALVSQPSHPAQETEKFTVDSSTKLDDNIFDRKTQNGDTVPKPTPTATISDDSKSLILEEEQLESLAENQRVEQDSLANVLKKEKNNKDSVKNDETLTSNSVDEAEDTLQNITVSRNSNQEEEQLELGSGNRTVEKASLVEILKEQKRDRTESDGNLIVDENVAPNAGHTKSEENEKILATNELEVLKDHKRDHTESDKDLTIDEDIAPNAETEKTKYEENEKIPATSEVEVLKEQNKDHTESDKDLTIDEDIAPNADHTKSEENEKILLTNEAKITEEQKKDLTENDENLTVDENIAVNTDYSKSKENEKILTTNEDKIVDLSKCVDKDILSEIPPKSKSNDEHIAIVGHSLIPDVDSPDANLPIKDNGPEIISSATVKKYPENEKVTSASSDVAPWQSTSPSTKLNSDIAIGESSDKIEGVSTSKTPATNQPLSENSSEKDIHNSVSVLRPDANQPLNKSSLEKDIPTVIATDNSAADPVSALTPAVNHLNESSLEKDIHTVKASENTTAAPVSMLSPASSQSLKENSLEKATDNSAAEPVSIFNEEEVTKPILPECLSTMNEQKPNPNSSDICESGEISNPLNEEPLTGKNEQNSTEIIQSVAEDKAPEKQTSESIVKEEILEKKSTERESLLKLLKDEKEKLNGKFTDETKFDQGEINRNNTDVSESEPNLENNSAQTENLTDLSITETVENDTNSSNLKDENYRVEDQRSITITSIGDKNKKEMHAYDQSGNTLVSSEAIDSPVTEIEPKRDVSRNGSPPENRNQLDKLSKTENVESIDADRKNLDNEKVDNERLSMLNEKAQEMKDITLLATYANSASLNSNGMSQMQRIPEELAAEAPLCVENRKLTNAAGTNRPNENLTTNQKDQDQMEEQILPANDFSHSKAQLDDSINRYAEISGNADVAINQHSESNASLEENINEYEEIDTNSKNEDVDTLHEKTGNNISNEVTKVKSSSVDRKADFTDGNKLQSLNNTIVADKIAHDVSDRGDGQSVQASSEGNGDIEGTSICNQITKNIEEQIDDRNANDIDKNTLESAIRHPGDLNVASAIPGKNSSQKLDEASLDPDNAVKQNISEVQTVAENLQPFNNNSLVTDNQNEVSSAGYEKDSIVNLKINKEEHSKETSESDDVKDNSIDPTFKNRDDRKQSDEPESNRKGEILNRSELQEPYQISAEPVSEEEKHIDGGIKDEIKNEVLNIGENMNNEADNQSNLKKDETISDNNPDIRCNANESDKNLDDAKQHLELIDEKDASKNQPDLKLCDNNNKQEKASDDKEIHILNNIEKNEGSSAGKENSNGVLPKEEVDVTSMLSLNHHISQNTYLANAVNTNPIQEDNLAQKANSNELEDTCVKDSHSICGQEAKQIQTKTDTNSLTEKDDIKEKSSSSNNETDDSQSNTNRIAIESECTIQNVRLQNRSVGAHPINDSCNDRNQQINKENLPSSELKIPTDIIPREDSYSETQLTSKSSVEKGDPPSEKKSPTLPPPVRNDGTSGTIKATKRTNSTSSFTADHVDGSDCLQNDQGKNSVANTMAPTITTYGELKENLQNKEACFLGDENMYVDRKTLPEDLSAEVQNDLEKTSVLDTDESSQGPLQSNQHEDFFKNTDIVTNYSIAENENERKDKIYDNLSETTSVDTVYPGHNEFKKSIESAKAVNNEGNKTSTDDCHQNLTTTGNIQAFPSSDDHFQQNKTEETVMSENSHSSEPLQKANEKNDMIENSKDNEEDAKLSVNAQTSNIESYTKSNLSEITKSPDEPIRSNDSLDSVSVNPDTKQEYATDIERYNKWMAIPTSPSEVERKGSNLIQIQQTDESKGDPSETIHNSSISVADESKPQNVLNEEESEKENSECILEKRVTKLDAKALDSKTSPSEISLQNIQMSSEENGLPASIISSKNTEESEEKVSDPLRKTLSLNAGVKDEPGDSKVEEYPTNSTVDSNYHKKSETDSRKNENDMLKSKNTGELIETDSDTANKILLESDESEKNQSSTDINIASKNSKVTSTSNSDESKFNQEVESKKSQSPTADTGITTSNLEDNVSDLIENEQQSFHTSLSDPSTQLRNENQINSDPFTDDLENGFINKNDMKSDDSFHETPDKSQPHVETAESSIQTSINLVEGTINDSTKNTELTSATINPKPETKTIKTIVEPNNELEERRNSKGIWYVGDQPILPTITEKQQTSDCHEPFIGDSSKAEMSHQNESKINEHQSESKTMDQILTDMNSTQSATVESIIDELKTTMNANFSNSLNGEVRDVELNDPEESKVEEYLPNSTVYTNDQKSETDSNEHKHLSNNEDKDLSKPNSTPETEDMSAERHLEIDSAHSISQQVEVNPEQPSIANKIESNIEEPTDDFDTKTRQSVISSASDTTPQKISVSSTTTTQNDSPRSDVENMDISIYGEDSLEAMYYSLKKHELHLDKMHKQASICKSASKERLQKSQSPESNEIQPMPMMEDTQPQSVDTQDVPKTEIVTDEKAGSNLKYTLSRNDSLKEALKDTIDIPDAVEDTFTTTLPKGHKEISTEKASIDNIQEHDLKSKDLLKQEGVTKSSCHDSSKNEPENLTEMPEQVGIVPERKLSRNESYYTACLTRPITSATVLHKSKSETESGKQTEDLFKHFNTAPHEKAFSLDDSTDKATPHDMLAHSISETDSDYIEPFERTRAILNDIDVSTALENTPSTDTDSTVISAATKIQAGARGFLTRRRLRRASVATTSFSNKKPSIGNDAIGESFENFIDEEIAARRIQKSFRQYRKTRQSAPTLRNNTTDSNSWNNSSEEVSLKIIDVKFEQKSNISEKSQLGEINESLGETTSHYPGEKVQDGINLDGLNLAARRMTLQRGDAVQRNSTGEDEMSSVSNNGSCDKLDEEEKIARANLSGTERKRTISTTEKTAQQEWMKRLPTRQRTMPVQIDFEILRALPKHLRKRISSADHGRKRKMDF